MTILDTFYILFKNSNIAATRAEQAALDKQLDDLESKGKKRDQAEEKRYHELKKQRKELVSQLKEQRQETDKLGASFQNMIQGAVGAVAAYASFSALKSGLIDANKLNASLQILQNTYGINAVKAKTFASAVERSTGVPAQAVYSFLQQNAAIMEGRNLPFDAEKYIRTLHNRLKGMTPAEAQRYIQQVPGGEAVLPFALLPDNEFEAAIRGGAAVANRPQDYQAALKNQEAYAKTRQAFTAVATEIDTRLLKSLERFNGVLAAIAGSFRGSPTLALGAGVGTAAVTTYGASRLGAWILRGLGIGGAAAGAAAGAGLGGVALGGAAIGASAWEGLTLEEKAVLALGDALGLQRRGAGAHTAPAPTSSKQRIMDFWAGRGYGPGAVAGWTANAQAESSFNPLARNAGHGGIYQWSAARRANILSGTGIDVWIAPLDDQLKAAAWEANRMGLTPSAFPPGSGASAALISNRFEIPALTTGGLAAEAAKRAGIAEGYRALPPVPGTSAAGRVINVKIDDVKIQTNATDAAGIAREVGTELRHQIRIAMASFDDGVNA